MKLKNKPKSILYIEDNRDIAESVKVILSVLGYRVKIALTGSEGLRVLKKYDFDLVIFDVMLPDMSGVNVFEEVRKHHEKGNKSCKYVFLSIVNLPIKQKKDLSDKGVNDYILKPFRKDELIKRISKVLNED